MAAIFSAFLTATIWWVFQVDPVICNGCGNCVYWCARGAITMQGSDAVIDPELCDGCGICEEHCSRGAIHKAWYTSAPDSAPSAILGPNPTSGNLVVDAPEGSIVRVYDASGRLVASRVSPGGATDLDISGRSAGTYRIVVDDMPAGSAVLLNP